MANRYVAITGVQLGLILANVEQFEHDPVNCAKSIEQTVKEIMENQFVGYTQNDIADDVRTIRDLFKPHCTDETGE